MCGIAGFAGRGSLDDLHRMNSAQASRGPDGEGTYRDVRNQVFLGHRRLSILDHEGGAQPMWTADGVIGVVFNGEIYNHVELRRELSGLGRRFETDHSDTEVLLHAYRQWGDELVKRLNGMWAFVIYDRARLRLFGSRDRFGKKPLYYHHTGHFIAFASELHALAAHSDVPRRVSATGMRKLFAYGYIPAPHSFLEGISKLPAGCCFEWDLSERSLRTWQYWQFELEPDNGLYDKPIESLADELSHLVGRAVRRRLLADVPVGTFLSGGIDSSIVTALAARSLGPGALHTFSIGFSDPSFDESRYALAVARSLGSVHHTRVFQETDALCAMTEIGQRLDEPLADGSLLPTWFLCRHARERVTVALGGDGADELFAGYDPFVALRWAHAYRRLIPRSLHRALKWLANRLPVSHRNMSLDFKLKRTLRGLDFQPCLWAPSWMAPLMPSEIDELLHDHVGPDVVFEEAIAAWNAASGTAIERLLQFFTRLYLQDGILAKVDRASMAHGLEVRAPFLDIEVVDFVRRLPTRFKFDRGRSKVLLRSAFQSLVPPAVLRRPKKGFGSPIGEWFRNGTITLPARLPAPIDTTVIRKRLLSHQRGLRDDRGFLLCAWMAGTAYERL